MPAETKRGTKKLLTGIIVSDKMEKSVVVLVERLVIHRRYKKYIRKRKKFMAHDPKNECKIGDKVEILQVRPISGRKRWKVTRTLAKAKV